MIDNLYFVCIESIADSSNIVIMKNDIVKYISQWEDGCGIYVEGFYGWSYGHELCFNNVEVAKHFEVISHNLLHTFISNKK